MFPRENNEKLVNNEKAQDDFDDYRHERTNARIIMSLPLKC